jgi:hypothetical protein
VCYATIGIRIFVILATEHGFFPSFSLRDARWRNYYYSDPQGVGFTSAVAVDAPQAGAIATLTVN